MGSAFPKLFHQYYVVHETIFTILHETNGAPLELGDIERRVKEAHPDLEMEPAALTAAIRQAVTALTRRLPLPIRAPVQSEPWSSTLR